MAWTTLEIGGNGKNYGARHKVFLIQTTADIADLPDCAPGSYAHNRIWFVTPSNASAVLAFKDLDGKWYTKDGEVV